MAVKKENEHDSDFKYIVRIASTDLKGELPVSLALTGIKGIGNRLARTVVTKSGVPSHMKIGDLSDEDIEKLENTVESVSTIVPTWFMNRRKDPETGKDGHLIASEIDLKLRDDINFMRKIRCYRGIRHEHGHKVRGQRTKSNGRHGLTLGVSKRKR